MNVFNYNNMPRISESSQIQSVAIKMYAFIQFSENSLCTCSRQYVHSESTYSLLYIYFWPLTYNKCWKRPGCVSIHASTRLAILQRHAKVDWRMFLMKFGKGFHHFKERVRSAFVNRAVHCSTPLIIPCVKSGERCDQILFEIILSPNSRHRSVTDMSCVYSSIVLFEAPVGNFVHIWVHNDRGKKTLSCNISS
jgi:hypothetical protein